MWKWFSNSEDRGGASFTKVESGEENVIQEGTIMLAKPVQRRQRMNSWRVPRDDLELCDDEDRDQPEGLASWHVADSHSESLLDRGYASPLSLSSADGLLARVRGFRGESSADTAVRYFFCWTISVYIGLCLLFGLGIVIACIEKWSALEALYFCVVTITTVGYGDTVPMSKVSKVLCCILISASLLLVATAFARMQHMVMRKVLTNNADNGAAGQQHGASTTPGQRLLVSCILLFVVVTSATTVLVALHEFDVVDALYFVVMTMTTVGYGDVSPAKKGGRIFTVALCILGPLLLGRSVSSFVEMHIESIDLLDEALALHQEAKARAIAHVDDSFDIRQTDESMSDDDHGGNSPSHRADRKDAGRLRDDEAGNGDNADSDCKRKLKRGKSEEHIVEMKHMQDKSGADCPEFSPAGGANGQEVENSVSMDDGMDATAEIALTGDRGGDGTSMASPFMSPMQQFQTDDLLAAAESQVQRGAISAKEGRASTSAEFVLEFLLSSGAVSKAAVHDATVAWERRCGDEGPASSAAARNVPLISPSL